MCTIYVLFLFLFDYLCRFCETPTLTCLSENAYLVYSRKSHRHASDHDHHNSFTNTSQSFFWSMPHQDVQTCSFARRGKSSHPKDVIHSNVHRIGLSNLLEDFRRIPPKVMRLAFAINLFYSGGEAFLLIHTVTCL